MLCGLRTPKISVKNFRINKDKYVRLSQMKLFEEGSTHSSDRMPISKEAAVCFALLEWNTSSN